MTDEYGVVMRRHARRRHWNVSKLLIDLWGVYFLAEILRVTIAPSEPHLYELAWDYLTTTRDKITYKLTVEDTLRSIRRLPETRNA